jgi:predicted outer membrane repeat protein
VTYDVRDVRFTGNEGGGARITGGSGRFTECSFVGNRSAGSGGAVRAERGDATFVSCTFRGNEANGFGGAVAGDGGTVSLLACTLEGNATRSGAWGGAVYGKEAVLELHGSDFARNRSIEAGGAVYLMGGIGDVSRCTFESNFSLEAPSLFSRGAGVRIAGSRLCGAQEIALGGDFAADDGNVFDEQCFGDCDQNGVADAEDIERGWAQDRDGNGVPDSCDPDCNMNGLPDGYEIGAGFAQDMNANGLIDVCEIRAGLALDADGDWIPDDAQNAALLPAPEAAPATGAATGWSAPAGGTPEAAATDPLTWGPGMRSGWMFEQGR